MANLRDVKLFEKEFEHDLNSNEIIDLNIDFVSNKNISKGNLNDFNSKFISNSIYEKTLSSKQYFNINSSSNLKISGSGILYLKIGSDCDLELDFEDVNFSNVIVNIIVEKNKKLNLIDYSNSNKLYKNIEIFLEMGAILNTSQFILNSKINHNLVKLSKGSIYNLHSVYCGKNIKNYILNKAIHINSNSTSNLLINGVGKENSKIINDAKVLIENIAVNSISSQKMYNLILNPSSQILSEPMLEVKNNDVECSHASSISQINDEILFYLESRGISKQDSIKLIIDSFYLQVIEFISNLDLKKKYSQKLDL